MNGKRIVLRMLVAFLVLIFVSGYAVTVFAAQGPTNWTREEAIVLLEDWQRQGFGEYRTSIVVEGERKAGIINELLERIMNPQVQQEPRIVPVWEVPAFIVPDERGEQTEGLINELVMRRVSQTMRDTRFRNSIPIGVENAIAAPWSHDLMDDIIENWANDPMTEYHRINQTGAKFMYSGTNVNLYIAREGEPGGLFLKKGEISVAIAIQGTQGDIFWHTEEAIANTLKYELFGRGNGMGALLSQVKSGLKRGHSVTEPRDWWTHAEFHHRLGEMFGYGEMFDAARNGHEYFAAWVNERIPQMNPRFNFTYEDFVNATDLSGLIARDAREITNFANQNRMDFWEVHIHFANAWTPFQNATNERLGNNQRNRAAQEFNNVIAQKLRHTELNPHVATLTRGMVGLSLFDMEFFVPSVNLNRPELGVRARRDHLIPHIRNHLNRLPIPPELLEWEPAN
jgi:hypothetical protein